jgi:hypothetical protein
MNEKCFNITTKMLWTEAKDKNDDEEGRKNYLWRYTQIDDRGKEGEKGRHIVKEIEIRKW